MEIIRTILTVIYFIVALAVIILATIQSKDDAGLSSTITGSSTNNFYEKNKGRNVIKMSALLNGEDKVVSMLRCTVMHQTVL